MDIYGTVAETKDRFAMKAIVCKKNIPKPMNFDAIEVSEMPDENYILGKIHDIPEKRCVLEENVFEDAKKTVEDIIETVAMVEDVLEPVIATQNIVEMITVFGDDILEMTTEFDDDILETVTVAAEKLSFVETHEVCPVPMDI